MRIDRDGLVTVYGGDGALLRVFPVDARELLAQGEYSLTPPVAAEPEAGPEAEPEEVAESRELPVKAQPTLRSVKKKRPAIGGDAE